MQTIDEVIRYVSDLRTLHEANGFNNLHLKVIRHAEPASLVTWRWYTILSTQLKAVCNDVHVLDCLCEHHMQLGAITGSQKCSHFMLMV